MMLCKCSSFRLNRLWIGEKELSRWRNELVPHRLSTDAVLLRFVNNLEHSVVLHLNISPRGLFDRRLLDFVVVAFGICFRVHWHREGFFLYDGIGMAVDSRVNSDRKDVLMVLRQHTRIDHVAIVAHLSRIDVDATDDTSRTSFDRDVPTLVQDICKDVLVVGQSDDELDDKFSIAGDDCSRIELVLDY